MIACQSLVCLSSTGLSQYVLVSATLCVDVYYVSLRQSLLVCVMLFCFSLR